VVDSHTRPASEPSRGARLIPLAVVTGAHGIRGELRVKLHNPASELFATLEHVLMRRAEAPTDAAPERVWIRRARAAGTGLWLVEIEGCADRDAAVALRGAELCVPREALPALPDGEHYLTDLVGLQARTPDGAPVGVVEEAIEYPAAQVLRVRVDRATIEVPLRAPYVRDIDLAQAIVIVDHLDDLDTLPDEPARGSLGAKRSSR